MDARRLLPTVLLVVLSGAAGALLGSLLHSDEGRPEDEVVRRQAARIDSLTREIRGLRLEMTEQARPTLTGRPSESPPREPPATVAPPDATGPGTGDVLAPDPATVPSGPAYLPPPLQRPGAMLDLIRHFAAEDTRQVDTAVVGDRKQMARLFTRLAEGPLVGVEEFDPRGAVADGTTIVLDAGVYDLSAFSSAHRGAFPADVTFRGIGMDRTLLVLHEVASTEAARNLGFEDLTLDTRGHYLADVRGDEPISLRFLRTRVIGFDQSPGGAVLLAARHGAFLAQDSRFEGGFGNAPGKGSFFHVRGPFLARFEGCVFVGPFARLYEQSTRASYAWIRCRFEQLPQDRRREVETSDPNVSFEHCTFEYLPLGADAPLGRSRAELNPRWR